MSTYWEKILKERETLKSTFNSANSIERLELLYKNAYYKQEFKLPFNFNYKQMINYVADYNVYNYQTY